MPFDGLWKIHSPPQRFSQQCYDEHEHGKSLYSKNTNLRYRQLLVISAVGLRFCREAMSVYYKNSFFPQKIHQIPSMCW